MKTNLIFLLICCSLFTYAQKRSTLVIGKVTGENGLTLSKATVYNEQTNQGTVSDSLGTFILRIPKATVQLRFSYIGYETQYVSIQPTTNDTLFLEVSLKLQIEEIGNVEVNSSSIVRVYYKKSTNIIDFEFYENNVVLLLNEGNHHYIRLVNDYDSALTKLQVSEKSRELYADCYGKILLIEKDSVFPIRFFPSFIEQQAGYSFKTFEKTVKPCQTVTSSSIVTAKYGLHNQGLAYFIVDQTSQKQKLLHLILDKESTVSINDYVSQNLAGYNEQVVSSTTKDRIANGNIRTRQRNYDFYKLVLSRPIYNPIFNIRDSLFLFDHLLETVNIYSSNGKICRTFPVNYHKDKSWRQLILKDYATDKVFIVFKEKTRIQPKQLNLQNGKLSKGFLLESHNFPKKIKVKDGSVYYLDQNNNGQNPTKLIYKQTIDL